MDCYEPLVSANMDALRKLDSTTLYHWRYCLKLLHRSSSSVKTKRDCVRALCRIQKVLQESDRAPLPPDVYSVRWELVCYAPSPLYEPYRRGTIPIR